MAQPPPSIRTQTHNLRLRSLSDISPLAKHVTRFFPKPEETETAIYELLVNALEHGNLEIGFDQKSELIRQGRWMQEVLHRLTLPAYAQRVVDVRLSYNEQECCLTITDEGNGFAWKEFVHRPVNARSPNGRGLMIAFNTGFDSIAFNTAGNQVTCIAHYDLWSIPEELKSLADPALLIPTAR